MCRHAFATLSVLALLVAATVYGVRYVMPVVHVSPVASAQVRWLEPVAGRNVPDPGLVREVDVPPVPVDAPLVEVVPDTPAQPVVPPVPMEESSVKDVVPEAPAAGPMPLVPSVAPGAEQVVASKEVSPAKVLIPEGEWPRRIYAKPFTRQGKQPIIAVVVDGLGLSQGATTAAVQDLPGSVSLAFSPYAPHLSEQMEQARIAGHELLLMVPMQSGSEGEDAGPDALMTTLPESVNMTRLQDVLGRGAGYVGILPYMGGGYMGDAGHLRPVMRHVWENGLAFVGNGDATPLVVRDVAMSLGAHALLPDAVIDVSLSRKDIDAQLEKLVETARKNGFALGIAGAYPVTIERLSVWAQGLKSSKVALAPVSAVFNAMVESR